MSECHETSEQDTIDKKAVFKLLRAICLCTFFMTAEVVGGVLSNSLAIATDAAHLLTDIASFAISLFSIWMSARPKSKKMSFGWHRAEVLGATVSVLMIWLVTGILVYYAVVRATGGDFEIDATVMLVTSGIGVAVNILMGATLHQHGHGHDDHHDEAGPSSQDVEDAPGQHGHAHVRQNLNVTAAFIHVVGDFIQSIGVFSGAIVIYFKPDWCIIDPILTIIFAVIVLATTIPILKKTVRVLLEATPSDINYLEVKNAFLPIKGIRQVHSLRIWGLTTDKVHLMAHLAIDKGLNAQEVLQAATETIKAKFNFSETTLQVEEFQEGMNYCGPCKEL